MLGKFKEGPRKGPFLFRRIDLTNHVSYARLMKFLQRIIHLPVKIFDLLLTFLEKTTMRRLLSSALVLFPLAAFSQTTLDITLPGNAVCSYATGAVTNGSTPGHLQATATSLSGAGCGSGNSGNVSFGPASPVSATPANLNSNTGTASIKFQAINANSCIGSISGTGATLNGVTPANNVSLCSGTTACQNAITVPAAFDNESTTQSQNYTVSVTCTGTSGQAASQVVVSVPKKGGGGGDTSCLSVPNSAGGSFTRVTTPGRVTDFHGDSFSVDYTTFDSSMLKAWPGDLGEQIIFSVPTSGFVSLGFTVPAGFSAQQLAGFQGLYELSSGSSGWSAKTSLTISTKCGDFSAPGSGGSTLCYGNALAQSGFILFVVDNSKTCNLTDNTQYYLNFINANVAGVGPNGTGSATSTANANCTGSSCVDTIQIVGKNWH